MPTPYMHSFTQRTEPKHCGYFEYIAKKDLHCRYLYVLLCWYFMLQPQLQGLAQVYLRQVFNADQVTVYTPYTDHTYCSARAYVISQLMYAATGTSGKVPSM